MANRINLSDLQAVCNRINRITGNAIEAYTRNDDGKLTANIGTYTLDSAYGGWQLVQIVNDAGGVRSITIDYIPKRELYHQMQAFLSGLETRK